MPIRDCTESDRTAVLAMADSFYHSGAVDHPIPPENYANAYSALCNGGSAYLRGLLVEYEGHPAGFCTLAFSYSVEAGGPVVLIEDLYIKPEYRGQGLGKEVFTFIKTAYRGKAARLRLEAAPNNTRATSLYRQLGFTILPYLQLINEYF